MKNPLKRVSTDANIEHFERYIKPHIQNKHVLDIGCVEHTIDRADREGWLHGNIREVANQTVGIDIVGDAIEELQDRGYNVEKRDVQAQAPNAYDDFDVVVMGEVIEHLTDFRTTLSNVSAWLKPEGKLILTTPNALSAYWLLLRGVNREFINPEHTCWFDAVTLEQLLSRYNFELTEMHYVRMSRLSGLIRPTTAIGYIIERLLPSRIAHRNMIAIAEPE